MGARCGYAPSVRHTINFQADRFVLLLSLMVNARPTFDFLSFSRSGGTPVVLRFFEINFILESLYKSCIIV